MDRAMAKDATGEPTGFRNQSNIAYLVHGLHGMKTPTLAGNYGTKAEALRAAQQAANEEGEAITISTPKGPWITVQPRVTRTDDAQCSVEGCTNSLSAYNKTGMCGWHSVRAEKGLPLDPCSVKGCSNFDPEAAAIGRKCLRHNN